MHPYFYQSSFFFLHKRLYFYLSTECEYFYHLCLADIDECEDVRLCAYGQCINTEGSFQCQCYPGYQRTQEGSHCEGTTRSTFTSALAASWQQPHQSSLLFLFVTPSSMSANIALMVYKNFAHVQYKYIYICMQIIVAIVAINCRCEIMKSEWYILSNIYHKYLFYSMILYSFDPFRYQWMWKTFELPEGALYQQHGLVPLRVPEGLHVDWRTEMPRSVHRTLSSSVVWEQLVTSSCARISFFFFFCFGFLFCSFSIWESFTQGRISFKDCWLKCDAKLC